MENEQAAMLCNRLSKRYKHLKKWAKRNNIEAFRLYDRDIPEIPLLLDLYGTAIHGALYKRPYEKDPCEEERWLKAMSQAISRAMELPLERIFIKLRQHQKGAAQYHKLEEKKVFTETHEGGLCFKINLSDYLDSGLFLDRRKLRSHIGMQSANKRLLNLFCYTGSFSVYAAAACAVSVDSVDLSKTYLDWAAENFRLNTIACGHLETQDLNRPSTNKPQCRLIRADVLAFLEQARKLRLRWDIIILDPPSFSNSKKMASTLDLQRDHNTLIGACLNLLNPKGKLYFSANTKHFHLNTKDLSNVSIEDITETLRDEDFQKRSIPACFCFSRNC
ncbi:class I SAM-dependent methyltransferase [Breznakiellaceae bacterium SP9]